MKDNPYAMTNYGTEFVWFSATYDISYMTQAHEYWLISFWWGKHSGFVSRYDILPPRRLAFSTIKWILKHIHTCTYPHNNYVHFMVLYRNAIQVSVIK